MSTAINHTELPFDELLETRLRPSDCAGRIASRIMQNGGEIGIWIETDWDGPGPVAWKIMAVNDLLEAAKFALAMPDGVPVAEWNEARAKLRAAIEKAQDRKYGEAKC